MVVPCPEPKYKHVVPGLGNSPLSEALSKPAPSFDARGFHCRHSFRPSLLRRSPRRLIPLTAFRDQRLRPSIRTRSEKDITNSPLTPACSNLTDLLLDLSNLLRGPGLSSKVVDTSSNGYLCGQHSSNGSSRPLRASANPRVLKDMTVLGGISTLSKVHEKGLLSAQNLNGARW